MPYNENLSWLYNTLTERGMNLGTIEETAEAISADENNRRWLYEAGRNNGINMGSYEEFEEAMGLPKFQAPTKYGEEPIEVKSAQPKAEEPKQEDDYLTSDMPEEVEPEEEYDFNREVLKDYVPQFKNEIKEKFPNARMYGFSKPVQLGGPGMSYVGEDAYIPLEDRQKMNALSEQLKLGQITKEQYENEEKAIRQKAVDKMNEQFSEDTLNASAALHLMNQAQKRVKLVDGRTKSNVVNAFRGVGHFDYAGLNPALQFVDAYRSFALLNKVAENPDAELSESEQYLLQAIVANNAVNDTFQTNMAERIGQGLPESMAFMAQFALTGGVGSAVGKLAKEGVEKGTKKTIEHLIKKGIKNAERRLYDDGFKGLAQKGLDRTLNTVIPGVVGATTAAATQTILNPAGLASGTYERAAGTAEYTLAPDGTPIATGEVTGRMGLGEAFAKEFGAQTIEQLSERAGASLGIVTDAGKAVVKTTGKAIASKVPGVQKAADAFVNFADNMKKTKVGDLVGKAAEWLENKDLGVKALAQKVGWNGTIEEWYEEQANTLLNAMFVGDEELSALFNGERQLETFLSVAVVGGATRLLSAPAAIEQRAEVRKEKQNLKNTISDIEKRVQGNSTLSNALKAVATAVDTGTVGDVAIAINEANRQLNLDTDTKRMFLDYASARMMSNMWRSNDRRQASKLAEGVYAEVEARTHKQSGTITVAEYTDKDGNKQNVDIIDGVIIRDGGEKIDSTLSDRSVVVRMQDGTTQMVPSKSLGNIVEEIDPAQYRAKLANASARDMAATFFSEYSARTNKHGVYYNEDGSLDYYHATPGQTALSLIDELGSAEAAAEYAANQLIGLQGAEVTSAEGGEGMSIETQNALSKWQAVSGLLADITAYNAQQAAAAEGKAPEGVEPMENPLPVDAAAPARNLRTGDRLRLTVDNGEMAEATIGGKTSDGNYVVDFDDTVTIGGKKGVSHELTPEVIAAMQYVEEVQEGDAELQAEQTPEQDDVTSYKDMAIGRIPLKADGSRNWEAVTPAEAAQAINAERDGDFDASIAFAQQMAQNCANAVADLANTELEVEDPTNADMVAAAEAQRAQAIASMQKTADFWSEVTNILNTANTERTKPAEQEAPAVEETPTTEDAMPMIDEDTPDFVSAGPERSAEFLSEQFGDDAESFIQDNIAEAQKALADAQGKKPKSTNFAERKKENEAIAQEKVVATAALDFWNAVGAAYAARQSAVAEEVAQPEVVESSEQPATAAEEVAQPEVVESAEQPATAAEEQPTEEVAQPEVVEEATPAEETEEAPAEASEVAEETAATQPEEVAQPEVVEEATPAEEESAPTEEAAEKENAPAEQPEEPTPTAKEDAPTKIEDFGEKIGGARKDVARQRIKDSMAYSRTDLVNLKDPDKILSRANIIKYVKEGEMTIQDATTLLALNMAVRGEDLRKGLWLEKYRDAAFAWSKGQDVVVEVTDKDVDEVVESLGERARQRANIRQVVREGLELTLGTYTDYKTTYEALNYPEVNRMMKSVYIRVGRHDGRYWVVASPKASRGWSYATMSQAVAKMQVVCPVIPEEDSSKGKEGKDGKDKIGHLHIVKDERGYYRIKSRNIPGSIYLSKRFNSKKVAEQFLQDNAQELVQREIMMTAALMGSNIGMVERKGPDYRNGRDVTPQDFLDTFGVRGVEFGNWVPQAERQLYLNKSYDAIMDLCKVVGISPKAFSLGGRLALAFGSRGKSRALAHYEPLKEVINLTRMKGAGSLAHEWFHALDNYLSRQVNGNVGSMTTRDFRTQRSEVAQEFRNFVRKMGELAYSRRSSLAGPYWYEVWERAARLFESYVYNKLAEQNIESPLLVVKDTLYDESNPLMGEAGQSAWPYPSAEENEEMKPFFDTLFGTIQEREENGKAVLYQIEDSDLNTAEAKMSTEEVLDLVKAAGIEVEIATPEMVEEMLEMQNALMEAKMKSVPETVSVQDEHQPTVVSSTDGAKVLNNLDNLQKEYQEKTNRPLTFIGDVAKAIGAKREKSDSEYATFEAVNGDVVTIRLSDHSATTKNFDIHNETEGISLVISAHPVGGIDNTEGKAHIVEFYYNSIELRRADGKPLVEIIKSIKQALYSGEYTDNTGLAKRQEVNEPQWLRTTEGEVYGWVANGKIYLTEKGLNPETPIHEYTHIWDAVCQRENPKLWAEGVALMKQTPLWEQVRTNPAYADIADNEDALASEVHARLAAPGGTAVLVEMMEQQKAEATLIGRIHNWLRKFWRWLRKKEMPESKLNVDKFARMPLKDLAMGKRLLDGIASANGKQKVAGQEIMDAFGDVPMAQIGRRRQEEMYAILAKRRQDLSDAEKLAVIAELDKLDNNKLVNAAFHYFVNGTVRLPEDMPKVEQAVKVAEIAKVDPAAYKSPMELINAHADVKLKEARIDPDTVPTLYNKVEYEDGLAVYDVEESEESRQNMRRIINTHFGEDSSPWCLLQGDGKGNLTGDSERYWNHYNAQPKRVAFQNGKLLAFFASDGEPTWWDRKDAPHEGIPATRKLPDNSGRVGTVEFDEEMQDWGDYTEIHLGKQGDKIYEEWIDEDTIDFREIREEDTIYHYSWDIEGILTTYMEKNVSGSSFPKHSAIWNEGDVESVTDENGTIYDFSRGNLERIQSRGKTIYEDSHVYWAYDGLLRDVSETTEKGNKRVWFGKLDVERVEESNANGIITFNMQRHTNGEMASASMLDENGVRTFVSFDTGGGVRQYRVGDDVAFMHGNEILEVTSGMKDLEPLQILVRANKVKKDIEQRVSEYAEWAKQYAAKQEEAAQSAREPYANPEDFERQMSEQLKAATSKGNIRYRTKNMQPRPFEEGFALLQQRYEALDKNDTEALEAFRAEKRNLVERYWESLSEELGFETEIILVDSTNNPEALRPIYEVFLDGYDAKMKAEGEELYEIPSFEKFLEEWNRGAGIASYINGTKYIAADIARFDHRNDKKILTQILLHEYIHYLIDTNIDTDVLTRIGEEVSGTRLGQSIKETYGEDTSTLGDEMLAYTIAGYENTDINPLLGYIQGEENISIEDVMSKYNKSLPLRNDFAKHIINLLRDGYIGKQDGQTSNTDTRRTPRVGRETQRKVSRVHTETAKKSDTDRKGDNRRGRDGGEWANIAAQAQTLSTAEIEEYINEVTKSLPEGVKVVVTNSVESGDREHSGWYDMGTDTVYINADMCDNTADVGATIVHELVGHRSMPTAIARVIGRTNATDRIALYTKLATMLPKELLDRVMAKTAADMDLGVAVDEVLAEAVENADLIKPSVWQRICSEVRAFFRRVFNRGISLSDGDIKYMFWLAAHNINNDAEFVAAEGILHRLGAGRFKRNSALPTEEQEEYDEATLSKKAKATENWLDSLNPLKKLQETVAKHHGELKPFEDAYNIELSRASRTMARFNMMSERYIKPVVNAISALTNNGTTRKEVGFYMIAKHGLERNAYYREQSRQELNDKVLERIKEASANNELSVAEVVALVLEEYENEGNYFDKAEMEGAVEFYRQNLGEKYEGDIVGIEAIPIKDYSGLTGLMEELSDDPDAKDFTKFAQEFVKDFEGRYVSNVINTLWDKIRDLTNASLIYQKEGGIISSEQYNALRGMYRFYVPLRGWEETTSDVFYEYTNPGARFQTVVKAAKGRKSLADDPVANMANMLQSAVTIVEKNASKQAFVRMAMNRPDSPLVRVVRVRYERTKVNGRTEWVAKYPEFDDSATPEQIDEAIAQFNEDTKAMLAEGKAKVRRSQVDVGAKVKPVNLNDHYVKAMFNGEEVAVIINGNPAAARALDGKNAPAFEEELQKTLGRATRYMAQINTTYSPKFVVNNLTRDYLFSSFSANVRHGGKYFKNFQKNVGRALVNLPKLLAEGTSKLTDAQLDNLSAIDNNTLRYFIEFFTNGGETGFSQSLNVEEWKKEIDKQVEAIKEGKSTEGIISRVLGLMESANRWAEDVPRFAAYMTSREMGKSISESIKDAKEISVNFARHGAGGWFNSVVRKLFPFVNAGIQGLYNIATLAKENPKRFWTSVAPGVIIGLAQPFLSAMLIGLYAGDDDDEKEKDLRNLKYMSPYINSNRLVIPTGNGFLTIPLPHELVPFYAVANAVGRRALGYDGEIPVAEQLAGIALSVAPLDFISQAASGVDFRNFVPAVIQPVYDVFQNEDFMGNKIYRSYDFGNGNDNRNAPGFTKAPIDTWWWLTETSRLLSNATGGDGIIRPGLSDFHISNEKADVQLSNPAVIQHLIEGYFGGMVSSAERVLNIGKGIYSKAKGDETAAEKYFSAYNMPIVSGWWRESKDSSADNRIDSVFDEYGKIAKECRKQVKTYTELWGTEKLDKIEKEASKLMESEEYEIMRVFDSYGKQISSMEKDLREARNRNAPKAEIDVMREDIRNAKLAVISIIDNIHADAVTTKNNN